MTDRKLEEKLKELYAKLWDDNIEPDGMNIEVLKEIMKLREPEFEQAEVEFYKWLKTQPKDIYDERTVSMDRTI